MKSDHSFMSYRKINSNWFKKNVRAQTIKLLKENIGKDLHGFGLGSGFFGLGHQRKQQKGK